MSKDKTEILLKVRDLHTHFYTYAGVVKALDGVNLDVFKGEMLGLAGETGCGKSITALSILKLIRPPGKIVQGEVHFEGRNLLDLREKEMRRIRGKEIAMVFQDPALYLNPVLDIGFQISESLLQHANTRDSQRLSSKEIKNVQEQKVIDLLRLVNFPDPKAIHRYPHQLSGGMKQRVLLAIALACNPKMLILDEPTTQLDVTVQAQVVELLKGLRKRINAAIMFITHNLALVAETCQRVAIMYAGTIVECGEVRALFTNPRHPYTTALLKAVPRMHGRIQKLEPIPGNVPNLISPPRGCRFHPRCPYTTDVCRQKRPGEIEVGSGHMATCHLCR